jgi:phosphate transport system permease protein
VRPLDATTTARRARHDRFEEAVVRAGLGICAGFSVLVTLGIVVVLVGEALQFFTHVSPIDFLTGRDWAPLFEPRHFGVLPLVAGTFVVTVGAALVGLPAGLGVAVFLNEYCPLWLKAWIKPLLEVLAGIPTVVYGYFAVQAVTPLLQAVIHDVEVFNAASAAIVVGIMILPMVASLADDALRAVPTSVVQGGYALGATKFEVTTQVKIPAALSGIVAAFILALSRALGETMAVTLAAGATPTLSLDPFVGVQTLTAYIVQVSLGDTPHGTIEYQSIFAVGLVLFVVTMGFNLAAAALVKRFRSLYE